MIRTCLIVTAILTLACTARGELPDAPTGLTEAGHKETIRRGNFREELGGTQADQESTAIEALAPPEDDSDHWFLCIVKSKDPKWKDQCDQLMADFSSSIHLRAWADPTNPLDSWAHYDVRDINDPLQVNWFRDIREQLEANPFPAIVIQPPKNGKYGQNATTAGIIHGYNGNPIYTSNRIQAKIKEYSDTVTKVKLTQAVKPNIGPMGHAQSSAPTAERNQPRPADNKLSRDPTEWPDLAPPPPKHLSIKRIQELCPGAPSSFIRDQHKAKASDEDSVSLDWMAYQEDQEKAKAKAAAEAADKLTKIQMQPMPAMPLATFEIRKIIPDSEDEAVAWIRSHDPTGPGQVKSLYAEFLNKRIQEQPDEPEGASDSVNPTQPAVSKVVKSENQSVSPIMAINIALLIILVVLAAFIASRLWNVKPTASSTKETDFPLRVSDGS